MTWLLPSALRPCALESGASTSGSASPSPAPVLWCTSSGTASPRPSSWPGWKRRIWSRRLFGAVISPPSTGTRGEDTSTSSPLAFPVNLIARPESAEASRTSDGSGATSSTRSTRAPVLSCFSRTFQGFLLQVAARRSGRSSPIWPRSGSMRNGLCSARATSGRRTSGIGSSSSENAKAWPTPRTGDGDKGGPNARDGSGSPHLSTVAIAWPTPTEGDAKASGSAGYSTASGRHEGTTLTDAVRGLWATPTSRDWKDGACSAANVPTNALLGRQAVRGLWATPTAQITNEYEDPAEWRARRDRVKATGINGNGMGEPLTIQARSFLPAPSTWTGGPDGLPSGLVLSPRFVEVLMGYPVGWTEQPIESTDCAPSETPWFRCKPVWRFACSRIASALISDEVTP